MSSAVNVWLILAAARVAPQCAAQAYTGDWAAEITDIKEEEVDKEWREYVQRVESEYDEIPQQAAEKVEETEPPPPQFKPLGKKRTFWAANMKTNIDWTPASPREVPFVAVLFVKDEGPSNQYKEYFKGETDPGISHIEPHKACGGAVLSPKHILTQCGCLSYLISEKIFEVDYHLFPYYDKTPKFDLRSHIGGSIRKPPLVHVEFSFLRFEPEETYEIDTDKAKWPKDEVLNCKQLIRTQAGTPDPQIRASRADGELIVVPFTPPSREVGIYPKWPPPLPISKGTDPLYKENVKIASVGMRLTEKTKIKFHSSTSLSSLNMKHCNVTTNFCDKKIFPNIRRNPYVELDKTHVCFCSINKRELPQLVGGVIGWPVVDENGDLVGLTASERRPADGTLVVAVITRERKEKIEDYIGRTVLQDQNIPSLRGIRGKVEDYSGRELLQDKNKTSSVLYRQKDLNDKYLVYDYWAEQRRFYNPDTKLKGGATKLGTDLFHLSLAFFALPCFV